MKQYQRSASVQISKSADGRYLVFQPKTNETFEIGEKEYRVLSLLDGRHTLSQIQKECDFYTAEEIQALIHAFAQIHLLDGDVSVKRKWNPLKLKLQLFNPNQIFQPNSNVIRLLSFIIVYCAIPLFFIGLFCFIKKQGNLMQLQTILQSYSGQLNWKSLLAVVISSVVFLSIHECSHAVVARRYGMSVAEMGIMLYLFMPIAYTNINGLHQAKSKADQLKALFAGCFGDLICIGVVLFLAAFMKSERALFIMINLAVSNALIIASNMLVFIKFDGYYIFQVLLEESFLREKGVRLMAEKAKRKPANRHVLYFEQDGGIASVFYWLYILLSVLLIPLLLLSNVLGFLCNT